MYSGMLPQNFYQGKVMLNYVSFITGVLLVCSSAQAEEGLPFPTQDLALQKVVQERVLDGTVDAVNQTTVSAETSGVVSEIKYDVNDFVKQGEVIVVLKDVKQKAGLKEAIAAQSEAKARLKQAQQEYDRISGIYARGLVSKSKLDAAEAELKAAKARFSAAKAAISRAAEQSNNTRVRAPYSGIVTERLVELGEYVNVGQGLMTGLSLDSLRVNVDVPQRLINNVRKHKSARVLPDNGTDATVAVSDLVFFPYANPATKTFQVRVNLAEKIDGLFPGMFVKVAFATGEESHLVVPEEAVAYRSEVTGVYVIDKDQVPHFRLVRLGATTRDGDKVVLAGLTPGETVALDPVAAGIYLKRMQSEKAAGEGEHE